MRQSFNDNWQFSSDEGRTWKEVTLPHDAQLSLPRDPKAPGASASAFFPGGSFLYKKTFSLTREQAEGHVFFAFGGVYKNAKVKINGTDVREKGQEIPVYGYLPFRVSGDGLVKEGDNTMEVSCDNKDQPDSRWYSGAGIYRPVWIEVCGKEYIVPGSVRVSILSGDSVRIEAKTVPESAEGRIRVTVKDPEGKTAAERTGTGALSVSSARLWSAEDPALYTAELAMEGSTDITSVRFGIRSITKEKDGIRINGKPLLLQGGCIHADNGVIGARETRESAYRRIRILKENGFNAIRSAHNPASEELLDACDELGMYVMDEMWDMWYHRKNRYDYGGQFEEHYQDDIRRTVEKDFNHPGVILYSIGNEVSEPAEKKGVDLAREMTDLFHRLDPSRLVTAGINLMIVKRAAAGKGIYNNDGGRSDDSDSKTSGMNSTMFNMITSMVGTGMNRAANGKKADEVTSPVLDLLDVAGYNYASGRYAKEGQLHPGRIIVGSETFPQDIAKNWAMVKKYPWLVGDFMWTAWDYLGEAGIGAWSYEKDAKGFNKPYPWLLGDTGAFDITGQPNGEAFWAKAVWEDDGTPHLAVQPMNRPGEKIAKAVWRGTNAIPSWNWNGCEGNKCTVEVYSTAPVVELSLNGKKIGRKRTKDARAVFGLKYEPGLLLAEAFDLSGNSLGKDSLKTGTGKTRLSLAQEGEGVKPGDLVYVDADLVNRDGIRQSSDDREITLSVSGGELIGFGSANPRTEERFEEGKYKTYFGHALAAVRVLERECIVTADDGTGKVSLKLEG